MSFPFRLSWRRRGAESTDAEAVTPDPLDGSAVVPEDRPTAETVTVDGEADTAAQAPAPVEEDGADHDAETMLAVISALSTGDDTAAADRQTADEIPDGIEGTVAEPPASPSMTPPASQAATPPAPPRTGIRTKAPRAIIRPAAARAAAARPAPISADAPTESAATVPSDAPESGPTPTAQQEAEMPAPVQAGDASRSDPGDVVAETRTTCEGRMDEDIAPPAEDRAEAGAEDEAGMRVADETETEEDGGTAVATESETPEETGELNDEGAALAAADGPHHPEEPIGEAVDDTAINLAVAALARQEGRADGPGTPEKTPSIPPGARLRAAWTPWRPVAPFLFATLAPVPLLVLAAMFGGPFSLVAFLWMTAFVFAADEFAPRGGKDDAGPLAGEAADRLSTLLAVLHFLLLPVALWPLAGGAAHGFFGWTATFLAFGLWFGQVSNSNAHELIHRSDSRLYRLGMWVYISMLFGHHTSAHRLVHHRFVATTDDPNTAAEGEGFYLFAARAWPGAFIAGYEMEQNRRGTRKGEGRFDVNPYTIYLAGGALCIALALTFFGFDGLIAYLLLCGHAQLQLLLSDYVQHYGLLRRELPSGTLEPAGPQHSWDAPHSFSGRMMLNAPRHADHHAHPSRRFPELRFSPGNAAPMLPYSLPTMATIALVPPLWHRIMDRRLAAAKRRMAA